MPNIIIQILYVAAGGAVGAVFRFLTSAFFIKWVGREHLFYVGTLIVNIVGCVIIGYLSWKLTSSARPLIYKLIFMTGFCGSFTTFSTFSMENLILINEGRLGAAITYTLFSIVAGVVAVAGGIAIAKW